MKLALVADTFPPLRTSGAVQLRDLSRELVRQGHDLTVFLPDPDLDTPWRTEDFDGARVLRLGAPRTKDIGYAKRAFAELRMPYTMRRNLAKSPLATERWDGVAWYSPSIFHAPLVRTLKRQSGCKGYLIIRDIFPEWAADVGLMRRGPIYWVFRQIARRQYAAADIIGVQSPGNLGYFRRWHQMRPGRSLEVLQNWLDAPAAARCRIRVDQAALAGRRILVYSGNMGIAQDLDIILDLAARMRDQRGIGFLFVGRGTEVARLTAKAGSMALDNVLFEEEIDPDEIPGLYAQCAAGIVSLDHRHKSHNIPGKFLAYMQSGMPVLANVNAGNDLAGMIRTEAVGEVCETNDIDALERNCRALIAAIDADPGLPDRCKAVFQQNFAVQTAARQIVSALGGQSTCPA